MSSTDRVFRILESELNKNLAFTFTIVDRQEPGTRRVIRAGQRFTVDVRVRNDSTLTMTDVRGALRPTAHAAFEQSTFTIERLRGGETRSVATLQVKIDRAPERGYVFDELISVTVNAQADLSRFRFHDTNRQVRYAQSASDGEATRPPLRTARVTIPDRPQPSGRRSAGDDSWERPRRRGFGLLRLRTAPGQG